MRKSKISTKILNTAFQAAVFVGLLYSGKSLGKETKTFEVGKNKISLDLQNNWQFAEAFLSAPIMLFGPFDGDKRAAISISHTQQDSTKLKDPKFWGDFEEYKKGRIEWLKLNNATSDEFFIPETKSIGTLGTTVIFGHSYTGQGVSYIEKMYFFNCNGLIYNISTLATKEHDKLYKDSIEKTINSIQCLKK